ncbi:uncharacterized protein F4822DRAFT_430211 [Hypoxylon trugodes]|uniref:uncharacterized protein n=1 Tax=Hypoxylon trugodes TaxID=326681 RepID=UPI00219047F8|nr:uncharacterized protein F4822DRAFT_430211 [Hypoxylon trugodes]KAI1387465.1 hypothetical protein F4822DRAFT_430211 [Hypoxylon trugodes]
MSPRTIAGLSATRHILSSASIKRFPPTHTRSPTLLQNRNKPPTHGPNGKHLTLSTLMVALPSSTETKPPTQIHHAIVGMRPHRTKAPSRIRTFAPGVLGRSVRFSVSLDVRHNARDTEAVNRLQVTIASRRPKHYMLRPHGERTFMVVKARIIPNGPRRRKRLVVGCDGILFALRKHHLGRGRPKATRSHRPKHRAPSSTGKRSRWWYKLVKICIIFIDILFW